MRNARKVLLLATMALAAMAFAASSASAQTLEITNEATGQHCPAVTAPGTGGSTDVDGGCLLHATATNIILRKHVFGIESNITTCDNEFAGRVNELAQGYILEQILSGPSCARQACVNAAGTEKIPWVASGSEPAGGTNTEVLTTNFCVEPIGGGTDETCEIDVPFTETATNHRYRFGLTGGGEMSSHGISGFRCELVGEWNEEAGLGTHDGQNEVRVEVNHLN